MGEASTYAKDDESADVLSCIAQLKESGGDTELYKPPKWLIEPTHKSQDGDDGEGETVVSSGNEDVSLSDASQVRPYCAVLSHALMSCADRSLKEYASHRPPQTARTVPLFHQAQLERRAIEEGRGEEKEDKLLRESLTLHACQRAKEKSHKSKYSGWNICSIARSECSVLHVTACRLLIRCCVLVDLLPAL
jgi:hypothetical protein